MSKRLTLVRTTGSIIRASFSPLIDIIYAFKLLSEQKGEDRHTPFDVSRCAEITAGRLMQCFVTRVVFVKLQCASQTVLLTAGCCTALFSHPFRL